MDTSFNKHTARKLIHFIIRLSILYFLFLPLLLAYFFTFNVSQGVGEAAIFLFTDDLSLLSSVLYLLFLSLAPCLVMILWLRNNKELMTISITLIALHLLSLLYVDQMPMLSTQISISNINWHITPSLILLASFVIMNMAYFIVPNELSRPYLVLLPIFVFIIFYFDLIATNINALFAFLFLDITTQDKQQALYFIKSSFNSGYFLFYLGIPIYLFLLTKYWLKLSQITSRFFHKE